MRMEKNRVKTDVKVRLNHNTRLRIHHSLIGDKKSSFTTYILKIDNGTYRKWIEIQVTSETKRSNTEVDHVKPISSIDVSKVEGMRETFNWISAQPLI